MQDEFIPQVADPQSARSGHKFIKNNKIFLLLFVLIIVLPVGLILFSTQKSSVIDVSPVPTVMTTASRVDAQSEFVEDQLIVGYKEGVTDEQIEALLKKYNAMVVKKLDPIKRIVIKVPEGQGEAVARELLQENLVEEAERDYINTVNYIPNDTSFGMQWSLVNTGQAIEGKAGTANADINADIAWDVTKGQGVKVAIIDTGIDEGHPDLSSKIISKKIFNGTSINDVYGHGTHVAGIIGAITNNSQGVAGVCPECQLVIAKALDDSGKGPDSVWIEALLWAADQGVKVINISFGSSTNSTAKQDAVNYAWNKGIVIVSSSGNNGNTQQMYPCANSNVLCVSATDNKDQKSSFSNYGTWVDVAAPGSRMLSTLPRTPSTLQQQKNQPTTYGYLDGTSMATPVASGLAGLVWASQEASSANDVVRKITETADDIPGTGQYWAYGRINAAAAVGAGLAASPTIQPTSVPTSIITPSLSPTVNQNPTSYYVTPTIYCLGTQDCISKAPTAAPTATPIISYAATATPIKISGEAKPTSTPQISQSISKIPTGSGGGGGSTADKDLISSFLGLILQIISVILQFFQNLFKF